MVEPMTTLGILILNGHLKSYGYKFSPREVLELGADEQKLFYALGLHLHIVLVCRSYVNLITFPFTSM